MKKILLPVALLCIGLSAHAQNSLLKNPVKGALPAKAINKICAVANGNDAVLLVADTSGVYAVDMGSNSSSTATENTITSIPNFVTSKLDAAAGQTTYVIGMHVNSVNKAIYILAMNNTGMSRFLFKVEKAGNKVTMIDLNNVSYVKLNWGAKIMPQDMTFYNNNLYVSSGSYNLDGELGWTAAPFSSTATFTKRSTSFYKSNQGAVYSTKAPLETIAIGNIDGKDRIMGVTTCAPGFSFEASKLTGTGVLKVSEDFNVHNGYSSEAVVMRHDGKDWLYALHDNKVHRIGKKFIDGSQQTASKVDANAVELRDNTGKITVTADELKMMNNTEYKAMAYWDPYRLLTLEGGFSGSNTLALLQVSTEAPPPTSIASVSTEALKIYPNPAKQTVTIDLPANAASATATIIAMNGSVVLSHNITAGNTSIDISSIPAGLYTIHAQTADGVMMIGKLSIEK